MPDPIAWTSNGPYLLAALFGGYLLGSIPFGLILTRLAGLGDIRAIGSGNIGATNVLRAGSKRLAAATLLLDAGKGAAAVLIAYHLWGINGAMAAGLGAMLGHLFPVWLKFRGGKGVATGIGVLLGLDWRLGLMAIGCWLVVATVTRFSSLAALLALAATPVLAWFLVDRRLAAFSLVLALLVWISHRANIARLLKGDEPRIGGKKPI
ncbi:MAG: glycerol-3-phosphate 1-O-acyltransferase PlsY [Rhodospirillaceae bacterium]|nr:glycerol-3-phosphate 1-O-acyltransferase PlsY [Rhodospirillaceae bacterium]